MKKRKFIPLISVFSALLVSAITLSTVAWLYSSNQINPQDGVPGSILTSYFDSLDPTNPADGSEENPYVITRPVHYYNLVKLSNTNYEGFEDGLHFQFGKNLDGSDDGTVEFYKFNDNGVIVDGEYSNSLNMNYYSGDNALEPLGSALHPFNSYLDGKNLTVEKLHITGKNRSDIGVFGYIYIGEVRNAYFDNVTIDLAGSISTEDDDESFHEHPHDGTINIGYIAGHVSDEDRLDNVYINDVEMTKSTSVSYTKMQSRYSYIGLCDTQPINTTGEDISKYQFRPNDVYNYLNHNYDSISSANLVTRNTSNLNPGGAFSQAVTHSGSGANEHYTFTGKDNSTSASANYSLATAGYQKGTRTYAVQYKNGGNYVNFDSATQRTTDSPESEKPEGKYVYYDSSTPKWIYYTKELQGGSPELTTYNVFYIKYKNSALNQTGDYYMKYEDTNGGQMGYTSTAPNGYSGYEDYFFAFLKTKGGVGDATIKSNSSDSFYIYSPHNQKFAYLDGSGATNNQRTVKFGDLATINSLGSDCSATFTMNGSRNGSISCTIGQKVFYFIGYKHGDDDISPKMAVPNGSFPKHCISIMGSSENSSTETGTYYEQCINGVDNLADLTKIMLVSTKKVDNVDKYFAMSNIQQKNNRGAVEVETFDNGKKISDLYGIAKLNILDDGEGDLLLQDPDTVAADTSISSDATYLTGVGGTSNYLRTISAPQPYTTSWGISWDGTTNKVNVVCLDSGVSRDHLQFNSSSTLYSCYTGGQTGVFVYKENVGNITIYTQTSYQCQEMSPGGQTMVTTPYDVYYYDEVAGTSSRSLFDVNSLYVTSFVLNTNPTRVEIAPEIINGYNLVRSPDDLVIGETYVITANSQSTIAAGFNSGYFGSANVTFSGDNYQITTSPLPENTMEFVLGGSPGAYTLSCSLGLLGGSDSALNFSGEGSTTWTINIGSNNAIITDGVKNIKFNTTGNRFGYYSSGTNIQLYRHDSDLPQYIGDKIGNGYNPNVIDSIGKVEYYSTYMKMSASNNSIVAIESGDINRPFYNTSHGCGGLMIRIPNEHSLDFATLTLECTGASAPEFLKGSGVSVGFDDVYCTDDGASPNHSFTLSINKYNIYQLSYCTLKDGNIYSSYNSSGIKSFGGSDENAITEYVLIIGSVSGEVNVTSLDITFKEHIGNIGDFGKVGYRTATYAAGVDESGNNNVTANSQAPGQIVSFYFETEVAINYNATVTYTPDSNNDFTGLYEITFTCSIDIDIYVFNYDAQRARVKVNNIQYYGSYNKIRISQS